MTKIFPKYPHAFIKAIKYEYILNTTFVVVDDAVCYGLDYENTDWEEIQLTIMDFLSGWNSACESIEFFGV